MNSLAICVATMHLAPVGLVDHGIDIINHGVHFNGGPPNLGDIDTFTELSTAGYQIHIKYNTPENNLGVVGSYQKLYVESTEDLLMFLHDDVICREKGWNERAVKEFEDPKVGLVGFGGALWHGTSDLYKVPYKLQNLRRGDYLSNVDDAEIHGERFTDECDVSVLDGFALVIRRSFLERIGGWAMVSTGADFYCYDYAICALARRLNYRIRCIGIRCHHRGGISSVNQKVPSVQAIVSPEAYERSHRWYYGSFMDVMPARVKP